MKTVRDLMTVDVSTVDRSEVVGTVRDRLLDRRIHAVPVVDAGGRVVGIVSSLDLVEEWAPEQGITTVMSTDVRFVDSGATVAQVASAMLDERIHHLVVVDGTELVGIVSSLDLLRELAHRIPEQLRPAPERSDERAERGDLVVVHGKAIGTKERRGVITRTGPDGEAPYFVTWLEDDHDPPHEVMFFPGSDTHIEHPVRNAAGTGATQEAS